MADSEIDVLVEGATDKALIDALVGAGLLPERLRPAPVGGKDALAAKAVQLARISTGVIAMRDRDELAPGAARADFDRRLLAIDPQCVRSDPGWLVRESSHVGRIALVIAGVDQSRPTAASRGLTAFMSDDYVLELLEKIPETYGEDFEVGHVQRALALTKLDEVSALLRRQNVNLPSSKRFLDLLRGITGYRPARATMVTYVVGRAHSRAPGLLRESTLSICDDIRAALSFLLGPAP